MTLDELKTETAARAEAKVLRKHVLNMHGIDIFAKCRISRISHTRFLAMWVLRQRGYSMPIIARSLGLMDHTSVLHGLRWVAWHGKEQDAKALDYRNAQMELAA